MKKELKVKVCGMKYPDNIEQICTLPIDYIGFIFYPQSARFVEDYPAVAIPKSIKKVGVFVNADIESILASVKTFELQVIQLHGNESPDFCQTLQTHGLELFKALGIDDNFDWNTVAAYEGKVDFFLFDTKSKQYGGTGQTFDWSILKNYPYSTPYLLSGGLSLDNLENILSFDDSRLFGLDLNSKFEIEPGLKNKETLIQALKILRDE